MNKKISFPIAIIIIIILSGLAGFIILKFNFIPDFEPWFQNNSKSYSYTRNDYNILEREIKTLLEDANYCQEDSDCAVGKGYGCPFGCYTLYNKNVDLNEIEKKVKIYNENYVRCEYGCPIPPKTDEIKCENNKCVDVRFKNGLKIDLDINKKEYKKGDIIEISVYNLGEPVCFDSCNPFSVGKRDLKSQKYDFLEQPCDDISPIVECIAYKELKEFRVSIGQIYSEISKLNDDPNEVYRIKIPIYLECNNENFSCDRTETLYSDSFEIK